MPNASSTSATSRVAAASPPSEPRVAIERMKTPGSSATASMRMRSPSSAPPVNGDVGSTAIDADREARLAIGARELRGERALPRARRSGDADAPRAADARLQAREQPVEARRDDSRRCSRRARAPPSARRRSRRAARSWRSRRAVVVTAPSSLRAARGGSGSSCSSRMSPTSSSSRSSSVTRPSVAPALVANDREMQALAKHAEE